MADDYVNDGRCQADVRAEEEAAKADADKAKPASKGKDG
jgi:hypothetical protein